MKNVVRTFPRPLSPPAHVPETRPRSFVAERTAPSMRPLPEACNAVRTWCNTADASVGPLLPPCDEHDANSSATLVATTKKRHALE